MWSGSGFRIRSPDLDCFQNLTGTSLSKDTSVIKFSSKSDHSVQRYEPNCVKMQYRGILKNPSKIPESGSGGGWLPKFIQFFLVHRYVCGFYVKFPTDRQASKQTDTQTNEGHYNNVLGRSWPSWVPTKYTSPETCTPCFIKSEPPCVFAARSFPALSPVRTYNKEKPHSSQNYIKPQLL